MLPIASVCGTSLPGEDEVGEGEEWEVWRVGRDCHMAVCKGVRGRKAEFRFNGKRDARRGLRERRGDVS